MSSDIVNIDLYSVLELKNDSTKTEIKKKYRELSKKYPPDKGGNAQVFEMITRAYNVLSDNKLRTEYDDRCNQIIEKRNEGSFINLKEKFNSLMKEMKLEEKNEEQDKKKFIDMNIELDKKPKFKRDEIDVSLKEEIMVKKLKELALSRGQDDIELDGPIFNQDNFTIEKFNSAFDMLQDKKKDIIPHSEPLAWNEVALVGAAYDASTYNSIYAEDDNFVGDGICSGIDKIDIEIKKTGINVEDLQTAKYYNGHKVIDINYEKLLDDRLKERENFDRIIKNCSCKARNKKSTIDKLSIHMSAHHDKDDKFTLRSLFILTQLINLNSLHSQSLPSCCPVHL